MIIIHYFTHFTSQIFDYWNVCSVIYDMLNQVNWTVTKHTSFISVSYQQFMELKYVGVFGYISLCYNTTYDIDILLEGSGGIYPPFHVTIHHYKYM